MLNPLVIISLIAAITVHEFCHALAADHLGDPTPRAMGRLSLNPLAHLDPLGTIALILIGFGWGKPVPIDPYNLSHPRRDELLIALAGPASNLIMATITALLLRFILPPSPVTNLLFTFISINVILAVFNLIPIWPLDGSKIFLNLLPIEKSVEWERALSSYGPIILLAALFLPFGSSNLISTILNPIVSLILGLLLPSTV